MPCGPTVPFRDADRGGDQDAARAGNRDAVPAVGIDIGTTNTKLAVVRVGPQGTEVISVVSTRTPQPAALGTTLRRLLRRALRDAPAPAVVGIASMAETGVPLDAQHRPLGEWVRWDRHEAAAQADELARHLGWAELVTATGVRPSAKVPLAVWAWLRADRPRTWAAMASWAGVADLACLLLTGRLVTDHTLAGRTMAYLLPDGVEQPPPAGFDRDLLAEVGLRPEQLPAVVSDAAAGRVRAGFADCGLAAGTPVVVAGHDHAVGAFAAGVREPGAVADSLGTAEAILTVVPEPPDPVEVAAVGMSSVLTPGGRPAILAGSSTAGAVVRWWLQHEAAGMTADQLFAAALELGECSRWAPSDLLVLPYLAGRQTPAPDPGATLQVVGRRPDHTAPQLARAMLEGLCLHARWMLQEQARLAGTDPQAKPISVLGGAAIGIPAWLRTKAATLGSPVRVVTAAEPVAVGAAVVAAGRAGVVETPRCLPARTEPVPCPPGSYDQKFARFVAAATEGRGEPA